MRDKPVIPRETASGDVDEIIGQYLDDGAQQAALGFIAALERAYAHLAHHPSTGSVRYADTLDLPGLRFWPLAGYPHLVFYMDRHDHVDVWRVLHGQRDIPTRIREPERS